MDSIDFSQTRRWAAFVSAVSIAIPAPAWAASGDDGSLSSYASDALYAVVWILGELGISVRGLMAVAAGAVILGLLSWVSIKVFTLGKRAAGG
jgi:hypothetical protein